MDLQKNEVLLIIKRIVVENLDILAESIENRPEATLQEIGVNSISFIKIVVAIEAEFKFEFDDENLDFNKFPTLNSIVSYTERKIMDNLRES